MLNLCTTGAWIRRKTSEDDVGLLRVHALRFRSENDSQLLKFSSHLVLSDVRALASAEEAFHAGFVLEQVLFNVEATGKTSELAAAANYAVARHDDRDRIAPVGGSHGAGCVGIAESAGKIQVRAGLAIRNGKQGIPNFLLKGRAVQVERELEAGTTACEILLQLSCREAEMWVIRIFRHLPEPDAQGAVIFPKNCDETLRTGYKL